MATRTYLVFKENGKEVLNTQIFGNNFYDSTFFNEVVNLLFFQKERLQVLTVMIKSFTTTKNIL